MQDVKRRLKEHRAVVVAVIVARVVQVAVDDIIGVVAVRNGRMLTTRPVLVVSGMAAAGVRGCTERRVGVVDVE
jgi:hypothetical protein